MRPHIAQRKLTTSIVRSFLATYAALRKSNFLQRSPIFLVGSVDCAVQQIFGQKERVLFRACSIFVCRNV